MGTSGTLALAGAGFEQHTQQIYLEVRTLRGAG